MPFFHPVSPELVRLSDPVLAPRVETVRSRTIPACLERSRETGRIDAFRLNWRPGQPNCPHIYWDSDVAKVVEGMAHFLRLRPDPELRRQLDELARLIVSAQQPDGYLNVYYTVVEPDKRWTNLHCCHELYCAGHLIEAAVAHFQATGERFFLDAMCRFADYIGRVFGRGEGQKRGYPGHPELELALCKLADTTGEEKYLRLARYFVDERGRSPNYFVAEGYPEQSLPSQQADRPVREMTEPEGHAVRAVYLYSGMTSIAQRTGDAELGAVCARLFDRIVTTRMYVTGGIGSSLRGEAFEAPYVLPNRSAYAESCAAIGFALFASRLLELTGERKYADTLERLIYNAIPCGISLSGDEFFYQNMLEADASSPYCLTRQPWFSCSCCPTNFARFYPQIGSFLWSETPDAVRLNIPAAGEFRSGERKIRVSGKYPYDGKITVTFESDGDFDFQFRIPGWCHNFTAKLCGESLAPRTADGWLSAGRSHRAGDTLEVELDMPVRCLRADPRVHDCAGRVALARGPLVYALESVDNGLDLQRLRLTDEDAASFTLCAAPGLPEGTIAIRGSAGELQPCGGTLYDDRVSLAERRFTVTAIPYALWQNRGPAEMLVWIRA